MSEETYGTIAIKKASDAIIAVGNAIDNSLADGKIGWADAIHIGRAVPAIVEAGFSANQLDEELKDLSTEEKAEVVEYFKQEFNLENDKAEAAVEAIISLVIQYGDMISKTVTLARRILDK